METTVSLFILGPKEAEALTLRAGSDAQQVRWMPLIQGEIEKLYASHGEFVRQALRRLEELHTFESAGLPAGDRDAVRRALGNSAGA